MKKNIYGADILNYNVNRCKLLVVLFGFLKGENIKEKDIHVIQTDSLKHKWNLSGEYLRHYFQNKQCIYSIIDFNSTKVFDVQTYTAITFINKRKNESILYDRIDDDETPQSFLNNIELTENLYKELSVKKWRLLCGDERKNIYAI